MSVDSVDEQDVETMISPPERELGDVANGHRESRGVQLLERMGLLIMLIALCVFFSLLPASSGTFASLSDFRFIGSNQVVVGILALGGMFPLIAGEFDFSIGLTLELSAMITAGCLTRLSLPLPVAMLAGVGVGLAIGVINGYLVAYRGLNSFITTFAISTIVAGIIELYANGASILVNADALTKFGESSSYWLGIPESIFAFALFAVVAWYLLDHTPFGRYLHATGSNRSAANLVGLPVRRLVFSTFVLSGVLSSVAGILYMAQQASATPDIGQGYVLPAFAAIFLGATVFKIGAFNVWGTVLAVFFVAVGSTGLVFAGLAPWVQSVFQGAVLIVALSITQIIGRRRGSGLSIAGPKF